MLDSPIIFSIIFELVYCLPALIADLLYFIRIQHYFPTIEKIERKLCSIRETDHRHCNGVVAAMHCKGFLEM